MKKLNIMDSFKDKKFKYGGFSTAMTAVVIAIVIVINLIAGQKEMKFDLTKDKIYSVSQESVDIIKKIDKEVTITGLFEENDSSQVVSLIKELLGKYKSQNDKVKVEYVDPVLHPNYTKEFKEAQSIQANSVIVKSGSKYKILSPEEFFASTSDPYTGQQTSSSILAEQKITSALVYVTGEKTPTIYVLQGHEETELTEGLPQYLEDEGYTIKNLDLLKGEWKTEAGDVLLISSPKRDLAEDELKKINDFMANGGRALCLSDILKEQMPNFNKFFNSYGVNVPHSYIVEGDTNYMAQQNPLYLLPEIVQSDITSPILSSNMKTVVYGAQPIETLKDKKETITVQPLLSTSEAAYAKTNLTSKTSAKESGDKNGPFEVAVAVINEVDKTNTEKNSKLVLISSSSLIDSNLIAMTRQGNLDLFINSFGWLSEKKDSITVRPKSLSQDTLTINQSQAWLISALSVIIIPILVAAAGVTVWLRRRHL